MFFVRFQVLLHLPDILPTQILDLCLDIAPIVLWSPETAEHDPDYRELGRFPTEQQAIDFLSQD
jgi:hypothetical protein